MFLRDLDVGLLGQRLRVGQILLEPGVHPRPQRHLTGLPIGTCVDGGQCGLELLGYLLLGLTRDAFLNLLAGFGIKTVAVPGFPVGVGSTTGVGPGFLSDTAGADGTASSCLVCPPFGNLGGRTAQARFFTYWHTRSLPENSSECGSTCRCGYT